MGNKEEIGEPYIIPDVPEELKWKPEIPYSMENKEEDFDKKIVKQWVETLRETSIMDYKEEFIRAQNFVNQVCMSQLGNAKYFTPSIEDIRVGYECEFTTDGLAFQVHNTDDTTVGKLETLDVVFLIKTLYELGEDDLSKHIRVPYLTKEQIEAEGWEYSANYESIEDSKFPDELGFLKELPDNLTQFLLYYDPNIHQLRIEKIYNCAVQGWVFRGKVKDINTFRMICKLLNI